MSAAHPQPDYSAMPPRRAQIHMDEPTLKALLGLAADESLRSVVHDPVRGGARFVVESPRLRPTGMAFGETFQPGWDVEPPFVTLPLSEHYERSEVRG